MKAKNKLIVLLIVFTFVLTGCTTYLKDNDNKNVINKETGQSLAENILCKPTNNEIIKIYNKTDKSIVKDLPECTDLKFYNKKTYSGLWSQFFVVPLAYIIIKIGSIVGNYGLSVMLVGLLIRIILLPTSKKMMDQQQNMNKAKGDLDRLEKKYDGKTDNDSMMEKSREMMLIYQKHNISPIGGCITSIIQIPLFLAFLEAVNRVPVIFEEKLFTLQLGTTPLVGIKNGNYLYIALIVLIILTTVLSFKFNMASQTEEQQDQMKFMTNFMVIFISIASFSLPSAIALYWIVTNGFMVFQNMIFKRGDI